jgi:hypothetical protein
MQFIVDAAVTCPAGVELWATQPADNNEVAKLASWFSRLGSMCETATLSALLWGVFRHCERRLRERAKKHDCGRIGEKSK